ncbi:uncharacterized protein LOC111702375 isoform X2 [Eurytemora carolleeae]|uniref:uncharacterized protein LOC111702375 isoform X2 n=1 Tax=Eurytemora carolleeae TaxID=1294199 RepID=UPI000C7938D2|nr:uncharacterized protein LOC111702375 isoform X2 [Eurytemora carolleeae]|eukprot:XP_023329809.1 uncharacterized protein LOC111702375 isoform X2 [Eurytemora affinis]
MKLLTAVAILGFLIPLIEAQGNSSDLYSEFELRVDEYLTETARKNGCDIYVELVRLYLEDAELFCEEAIFEEVSKVNAHTNSVDFYLHAFGFILHHFWDNPLLSTEIKREIVNAVINIPLFLSYPGELNNMQYWSENHQIGWYAAEYLIGTGLSSKPELSNTIFPSSGKTAAYHADMGRYRVMRWLDFRLKYGFSEFNSDTYGPIAYKALVSVVACAPDQDVREKASIVMNLQLYDHILGSHGIKLATARGRAYSEKKLGQGQYGHMWLIKGKGTEDEIMIEYGSAQSTYFTLATVMGRYRIPETLLKVTFFLK